MHRKQTDKLGETMLTPLGTVRMYSFPACIRLRTQGLLVFVFCCLVDSGGDVEPMQAVAMLADGPRISEERALHLLQDGTLLGDCELWRAGLMRAKYETYWEMYSIFNPPYLQIPTQGKLTCTMAGIKPSGTNVRTGYACQHVRHGMSNICNEA